jgi:hypothetical protein
MYNQLGRTSVPLPKNRDFSNSCVLATNEFDKPFFCSFQHGPIYTDKVSDISAQ